VEPPVKFQFPIYFASYTGTFNGPFTDGPAAPVFRISYGAEDDPSHPVRSVT
jgi:hypothetical protein